MKKRMPWQSDADVAASEGLTLLFWAFVLLCASPFIDWVIKSVLYWIGF